MTTVPAPWRWESPPPEHEAGALKLSAAPSFDIPETRAAGGAGHTAAYPGAGPATPVRLPLRVIVDILVLGCLITAALAWTSWSLDNSNENRLLRLQTQQAGQVLAAALPSTQASLSTALEVASASNGDPANFARYISTYVGAGKEFTSVALWKFNRATSQRVFLIGSAALATSAQVESSLVRAEHASGLVVSLSRHGQSGRLGYALALVDGTGGFAIYAEHDLPADRKAAVAKNSAFSELRYAIYVGRAESPADLLATSFNRWPPTGRTAKVSVPFGDTVLTLVAAPIGPLGGQLPRMLPWIFGVLGAFLTVCVAVVAARLVRARRTAERDATQIRELYSTLTTMFAEQRTIAVTLQRAFLPRSTPEVAGMEFAVRYVPGAKGMDIGGDWYSVTAVDDEHFVFAVGDVSGRGLRAASVMAELHFTIRAYALEGNSPGAILKKCSAQLDILDGHFATVLIGSVDVKSQEVTLANAGHFDPLVIDGDGTRFIRTSVGVPLGVAEGSYEQVTVSLAPRSTMVAFTDGLVEHRGESLEVGLKRLQDAVTCIDGPVDDLLSRVITEMTDDSSEDDIAVLGLRWMA